MIRNVLKRAGGERSKKAKSPAQTGTGAQRQYTEGGSGKWIPFASFCTTGQFMKLGKGYVQHCGPTAAVNLIRSLEKYADRIVMPEDLAYVRHHVVQFFLSHI